MKRRALLRLKLNKKTVAYLDKLEMNESRGGADATDIGKTCYTSACCKSSNTICNTPDINAPYHLRV